MWETTLLIVASFFVSTAFLVANFSDIGFINRLLNSRNYSKSKKVCVKKLRKFLYIPHYGEATTRSQVEPFLDDDKFDGSVYKTTLILTIINYVILLINLGCFIVSLITRIDWFSIILLIISLLYMVFVTVFREIIAKGCTF